MLKGYREKFKDLLSEMVSDSPDFCLQLDYETCKNVIKSDLFDDLFVRELFLDFINIVYEECCKRVFSQIKEE